MQIDIGEGISHDLKKIFGKKKYTIQYAILILLLHYSI